jgi:hypothetical protein
VAVLRLLLVTSPVVVATIIDVATSIVTAVVVVAT